MEKTTIRFRVSGQNLTMVGNHHRFASNSVGLVRIEIDPEDEWIQFDSVDAVFQNDQDKTTMTMFYEGASYTCTVPADMLSRMAKVYVNLSGKNIVDGELVERLTTYPVLAFIIDETSNVSNYRDSVVPANQYEQFIEAVGRQASKLADVEVTAHESEEPEVIKTYTPNHPLALDFGLVRGRVLDDSLTEAKFSDELKLKTIKDYVTPEMFGAKGDGETDDSEAWQVALNYGATVLLATGDYRIAQPLSVSSNQIICGGFTIYDSIGQGLSDISSLFNINDVHNVTICDGSIVCDYSATTLTNKAEISCEQANNITICNLILRDVNGSYGIRCSASDTILVDHCIVDGFNHTAIANVNGGNNFTVQNCSIYDINTQDVVTYGIMLNGYEGEIFADTTMGKNLRAIGNHIRYTNPWWEAIDAHGGENVIVKDNFLENVYDGIAVYDDPSRYFTLTNCLIDGNIVICATSGQTMSASFGLNTGGDNVVVSNNIIVNGGNRSAGKSAGGMFLQYARSCKVFNNQIYNSKCKGIYVSNADDLIISDNVIKHVTAVSGDAFIVEFNNGKYGRVLIQNNSFEDSLYSFIFPNVTVNPKNAYFKVKNNLMKDVGDGLRMNLCAPDKHTTFTERGRVGDVIINSSPTNNAPIGWICTVDSSEENGAAQYRALPNLVW